MPIRFSKYIDIRSAVAAATLLAARQFGGRIYTPNNLVSPGTVLKFADSDDVGAFFGTASEEYLRSLVYFGYTSPEITSPQQLSFSRWVATATPARIFGGKNQVSILTTLKSIVAGQLTFVINGADVVLSAISFSAATSLADVATELQTALNANANPVLATATVSYDAANARFLIVGSSTVTAAGTINTLPTGTGITDVAQNLGLYTSQGATMTNSAPESEPVATFTADVAANNNFGAFIFIANGGTMPTLPQATLVAQQNKTYNVQFMYLVLVTPETYETWNAALGAIGGTGLIYSLDSLVSEFPEMQPMCILGATQFDNINGAPGYMYTQNNFTASVTDDGVSISSDALDALRINYYGNTQDNGQIVAFFQRGVMCGAITDPAAMNIYANEMWLKAFAGTSFFNFMMALKNVGANITGRGQLMGILTKEIIPAALNNGCISVGKLLDQDQIQFITEQTGLANAWQQVQNIGYWYDVQFSNAVAPSGITEYSANYTLIYAKDDLVLSINGTHALI